jgi:hypothetical protein
MPQNCAIVAPKSGSIIGSLIIFLASELEISIHGLVFLGFSGFAGSARKIWQQKEAENSDYKGRGGLSLSPAT